jgi:hypothetical protein
MKIKEQNEKINPHQADLILNSSFYFSVPLWFLFDGGS